MVSFNAPLQAHHEESAMCFCEVQGTEKRTSSDSEASAKATMFRTWESRFKYLFEKYKTAERGRAAPFQKSCTSRASVVAQSYMTSTGCRYVN